MLALMSDQKQQQQQQSNFPDSSKMSNHQNSLQQNNNSPILDGMTIVKPADKMNSQCSGGLTSILPVTTDSFSPCQPCSSRCSSSTVAASTSSSMAGLSSLDNSSSSAITNNTNETTASYSPPSPPLLPPKRPCHQRRVLASSSTGCGESIFRPVPVRPATAAPQQPQQVGSLVPGLQSLSLNQQPPQQPAVDLSLLNSNCNSLRCQSQPSLQLAAKRKHCDSCPSASSSSSGGGSRNGLSHTGRSYLVGLPTINSIDSFRHVSVTEPVGAVAASRSSSGSSSSSSNSRRSSIAVDELEDDLLMKEADEARPEPSPGDAEDSCDQLDLDQIESDL